MDDSWRILELDLSHQKINLNTQLFYLTKVSEKEILYKTKIRDANLGINDYFAWQEFKLKLVWQNIGVVISKFLGKICLKMKFE